MAAHVSGGIGDDTLGCRQFVLACVAVPDVGKHVCPAVASSLSNEVVSAIFEDFRQHEIKSFAGLRTGVHRHTEASGAGLPAIDGQDEHVFSPL